MNTFESILGQYDMFRVDDALLDDAYDAISAQNRAKLKTVQAISELLVGKISLPQIISTSCKDDGFAIRKVKKVVPWLLFVAGENANPSILCACASMARFSGVEQIAIVFLDKPKEKECFLALDLCGIDDIFHISDKDTVDNLFNELCGLGRGRIITLNYPIYFMSFAYKKGIPFYDADKAKRAKLSGSNDFKECIIPADLNADFFINLNLTIEQIG